MRLKDDDIMLFGQHKGRPLGDVPVDYWEWNVQQDWFREKFPDLYDYANIRIITPTSFEDALRLVRNHGRGSRIPRPQRWSNRIIEDPYADA